MFRFVVFLSAHCCEGFALYIMELKEFIKQTITDIKDAISELNQESESDNAVVTPQNIDDLKHPKTEGTHRNVTDIQFDLSLSVMEEKGKEGKLGVMNSIVSLGGTAKTGATHENVNRIQFTIPVCFPSRTAKK